MQNKLFEIKCEYHKLISRGLPMAVYSPKEQSKCSQIAILHVNKGIDILAYEGLAEFAKHGFIAAAMPFLNGAKGVVERTKDVKAAIEFLKSIPGVKKIILFGHSQGGCTMTCYQYIAENGVEKFKNTERIIPFPDVEPLPPADGMILADASYGIMDVLAMDPAIKSLSNGYERIPELDLYNPDNGYDPVNGTRYTTEFVRRFQRAQVKFYQDILAYAQERAQAIRMGKGAFADDEPIVIPGAGSGSSNNKLFVQDNSLLSCTRNTYPVLYNNGVVRNEILRTIRPMQNSPSSVLYHGGAKTYTVSELLEFEYKFGDFGYDASSIWGCDWDFNPWSTQGNVKGIKVPLLCEGNQGSHEFINMEYTYENAASEDKSIFFLAGADHGMRLIKSAETYPGEFGKPIETFGNYIAEWLAAPGRFID